jgi:hypothetical protein
MDPAAFNRWRTRNPDLITYLSITELPRPLEPSKWKEIRTRMLSDLQVANEQIHTDLKANDREAVHVQQITIPPVDGRIFDSPSENRKVWISAWLRRKLVRFSRKVIAYKRLFLGGRLIAISAFQELFSKVSVGNLHLSIVSEFFDTSIAKHAISKRYRSLQNHRDQIVRDLNHAAKPAWLSNFDAFLISTIDKGVSMATPDVYYFAPLPEETSLSRCLFATNSPHGRAIDHFLRCAGHTKFHDFASRIVEFCCALLPRGVASSPDRISAGMMIVFRVIMSRLFETETWIYENDAAPFLEDAAVLSRSSLESLQIPPDIAPHMSGTLREAFLANAHFREAAEFITVASFETNPIDGLWCINRAITQVHTGAIATAVGRPPTEEELKQLLPFDDLFALLVGTVMASDIPDLYQFGRVMKLFTPESCFSPLLEYAGAHLEAVIAHCKGARLG